MEEAEGNINKYIPFALIYFFCNSLFLPEGLLYTTLLTPLFLYELIKENKLNLLLYFLLIIFVFFLIHVSNGINIYYYIKSFLLFITVSIFCFYLFLFCSKVQNIERIFIYILYTNAILFPLALLSLRFHFLENYFWYFVPFTPDMAVIPRLKMFTYEASYYSLLLVPIVFYCIWNFLLNSLAIYKWQLLFVILPLLFSFSLGVLTGIFITIFLVLILCFKNVFSNKRMRLIILLSIAVFFISMVLLFKFFPNNALLVRLRNIPTGKDTSARGRTYEAFDLAYLIAKQKSVWFGVGLGQIKDMGRNTIVQYYQYTKIPDVIRIPNSVAETFAIYGFVGIILKFGIIFFMFFKTRVFSNYYRLSLFIFIFIYQFTGSFIFNIVEYLIWIFAFSNILPIFNKVSKSSVSE